MTIKLKKLKKFSVEWVKAFPLFYTAFPSEERPPYRDMWIKANQGKGDMLCAMDGKRFLGFAYMLADKHSAYLFFLAVRKSLRGKGVGSAILQRLKEIYPTHNLFLGRETLDESAPNYEQRKSRHAFYLKNGFHDLPCQIIEADVVFDAMGTGTTVTPEEYDKLIVQWGGRERQIKYHMRVIENKEAR